MFMQQYECIWRDDFVLNEIDINKWQYSVGGSGWGNGELQYYTYKRKENAEIINSKLVIRSQYEEYKQCKFTSAKLISNEAWQYGRFVIRAKLPLARGTWPAIWLLPTSYNGVNWPSCGEIDVLEYFGHTRGEIQFSLHSNNYNFYTDNRFNKSVNIGNAILDFNEYMIEWTESYISFFINNIVYYIAYKSECKNLSNKDWPFDSPFKIIINLAVGGHHAGRFGIDINSWPQEFVIDYIYVYQLL